MYTLKKDLPVLRELDLLRLRTLKLREEGLECLTKKKYEESSDSDMISSGGVVEAARVLWALRPGNYKNFELSNPEATVGKCLRKLKEVPNEEKDYSNIPVLASALATKSLSIGVEENAIEVFIYLYRIAYEVFDICEPYFTSGGGRASFKSEPTAFITNECIRAAISLIDLLRTLDKYLKLCIVPNSEKKIDVPKQWEEQNKRKLELDRAIRIKELSKYNDKYDIKPNELRSKLNRIAHNIKNAFREVIDISEYITNGTTEENKKDLSPQDIHKKISNRKIDLGYESIADVILHAVLPSDINEATIYDRIKQIRTHDLFGYIFNAEEKEEHLRLQTFRDTTSLFKEIKSKLDQFIQGLADSATGNNDDANINTLIDDLCSSVLERSLIFMRSIIDRELAESARHPRKECDAVELTFAVAGYGAILERKRGQHESWRDPRIVMAIRTLLPLLSEDGYLPVRRAFNLKKNGYRLYAMSTEVMAALCYVLRKSDSEIDPDVPQKMLRLFEITRAKTSNNELKGWMPDEPEANGKAHWWATALAVDSLGAIERMLNSEINRRVYRNFQVKRPNEIDEDLDNLFYPDYGLAAAQKSTDYSIAFTLQQMHAHLLNVKIEKDRLNVNTEEDKRYLEPLYSAVFYGPPGTGKTTILKALAKTANVPLLEVTPSDILTQGTDQIESRARAVFESLAMLTDTVILFDEFDSILFNRDHSQRSQPTSAFQFLTPGMLPKFTTLHRSAKKGRVVYALATNYIESLDRAAIREGRFDHRIGIFPPDVLSRAGRLIEQFNCWYSKLKQDEKEKINEENTRKIIAVIINETEMIPMTNAAKESWFTAPKGIEKITPNSPFASLKEGKIKERENDKDKDKDKGEFSIKRQKPEGRPLALPYRKQDEFVSVTSVTESKELTSLWQNGLNKTVKIINYVFTIVLDNDKRYIEELRSFFLIEACEKEFKNAYSKKPDIYEALKFAQNFLCIGYKYNDAKLLDEIKKHVKTKENSNRKKYNSF